MGRYALGNGFRSFTQLVLMVECHDSKNKRLDKLLHLSPESEHSLGVRHGRLSRRVVV